MTRALIGHSGFVGTTLKLQTNFDHKYRSINIHKIAGKSFDTIVCAGASAKKWLANAEPEKDWENIEHLIDSLARVNCKNFVLISTVDVFRDPIDVDEDSEVIEKGLHAYGLHRRYLEKFVLDKFENSLVVRLPGLVGTGLQKNVVYDFKHANNIEAIDYRNIFQFYPMAHLWQDISLGLAHKLRLLHLCAEPVSVADVALHGFSKIFSNEVVAQRSLYDFKSKHFKLFGGKNGYQYTAKQSLDHIKKFAAS